MKELIQAVCGFISNLFQRGFGDPNDTQAGDLTVSAGSDWQVIGQANLPCLMVIQNLDSTNWLLINWNKNNTGGLRVKAGDVHTYDNIKGVIYAKPLDPTVSISINLALISVKVND
jgi:hypothetical protein